MLNIKKLQAIRDNILGVTVDTSKYGDLNSVVYLQQILDAVNGVTSTPARTRGNLHEKIYLQKIRNAKLGVADGQFGSLSNSIYLQQIINAFNGAADTGFGDLGENSLLDTWYSVAGVSSPTVVVLDTFTGVDGTLLTAHTPDISPNPWVTSATSAKIVGNKASLDGAGVGTALQNTLDATLADCIVSAVLTTGQTTDATLEYDSLIVRAVDTNNEWEIMISKDPTYKFSIVERTASVATVRAIAAGFVYAPNTSYNLTVTLSGNSITVSCTGGYTGSLSFSSAVRKTATKHGLTYYIAAVAANKPALDNFQVTTLP